MRDTHICYAIFRGSTSPRPVKRSSTFRGNSDPSLDHSSLTSNSSNNVQHRD
jgi:hypothetical protein